MEDLHMRDKFEEQLEHLKVDLIKMGALCEVAISVTIESMIKYQEIDATSNSGKTIKLLNSTKEAYQKVSTTKDEIDHMERSIENQCLKILLQQQPVASDLRMVSATMKMIYDLQRIGEQANDIAEISRYINNGVENATMLQNISLKQMAEAVVKMVTNSVDAFVHSKLDLAKEVIAYDDVVDELFSKVKSKLGNIIKQDGDSSKCLDYLMIAKYLERIGDHAVNIAEWVVFMKTGTHSN